MFVIITIAFAVIIVTITYYNKKNIKNTYYNTMHKIISEEIKENTENLRENIENEKEYNFEKESNLKYEVYIQKIISLTEDDISIYNIYSSKYNEINNTYKTYDKKAEYQKNFFQHTKQ